MQGVLKRRTRNGENGSRALFFDVRSIRRMYVVLLVVVQSFPWARANPSEWNRQIPTVWQAKKQGRCARRWEESMYDVIQRASPP